MVFSIFKIMLLARFSYFFGIAQKTCSELVSEVTKKARPYKVPSENLICSESIEYH